MTGEQKQWIDSASYQSLLQKWRFAPAGEPLFQGETGEYYKKVMFKKRDALSHNERVNASKSAGWGC